MMPFINPSKLMPEMVVASPITEEDKALYNLLQHMSHKEVYKYYENSQPFMDDGNYLTFYLKGRGLLERIGFVLKDVGGKPKKVYAYSFKNFLK